MGRSFQPYKKCWFTDVTAPLNTHQGNMCQDFELRAMECIEYYGAHQGMTACKDWYEDFLECTQKNLQNLRCQAMFNKRHSRTTGSTFRANEPSKRLMNLLQNLTPTQSPGSMREQLGLFRIPRLCDITIRLLVIIL